MLSSGLKQQQFDCQGVGRLFQLEEEFCCRFAAD
jgi:hypothetical protein